MKGNPRSKLFYCRVFYSVGNQEASLLYCTKTRIPNCGKSQNIQKGLAFFGKRVILYTSDENVTGKDTGNDLQKRFHQNKSMIHENLGG